jgi:hypothetical protein
MIDERERDQTAGNRSLVGNAVRGGAIGLFAGIVQVVASQFVGLAVRRRERTDVAPRLVQRVAERLGRSPGKPERWSLATVFHFGYALFWGVLYTLVRASRGGSRAPWWLTGTALGGLIYTLAFSRIGGGTLLGSERPPDRREDRERVIQVVSAFSFAFTVAFVEQRSAAPGARGEDGANNG